MKKYTSHQGKAGFIGLIFLLAAITVNQRLHAQQTSISQYALMSGWNISAGSTGLDLGSGTVITGGGFAGSMQNIKSTGYLNLTGSVFSGGRITFSSSNTISGRVTAASGSQPRLSASSNFKVGGDVDVNGNISITKSGSSITGKVTQPSGSTYSGPTPAGGRVTGIPNLPTLPAMPAVTDFAGFPYGTTSITNSQSIIPGK
ncbi:MAG: hypothetical protein MUC31_06650 [Bacteroidales bacterium]|nr:hypothetical protein [Bacteroidales bacterium]